MNSIKQKQRDNSDCGAACLASVAAHYRHRVPLARIRQMASTDKRGTNLLGMIEAAKAMGFDAKGVRGDFNSLYKIPKPSIAHVIIRKTVHHYMVITEITRRFICVMDPGDGQIHKMSHEAFKEIWTGVLLLVWPGETFHPGGSVISPLSRFWLLLKPHRAIMTQAIIGAMIYTLLGLSTAIFVQKIVDYVLADGNGNLLNLMTVIMATIAGIQGFISVVKSILTIQTGQQIDARLILSYYQQLLCLPQQFFDTMRTGEILSRINDAVKIRVFINDAAIALIVNLLIVATSILLMMTYLFKMAITILASVPLYMVIYLMTNRVNKKVERMMMEQSAQLESQLVESISTMATIKSYGLEAAANQKTESRLVALLNTVYRSGINGIMSNNATELVTRLLTIVILWSGSKYVLDNEITPGILLSFYALIAYFTGPLSSLIGMNKIAQNAIIAADRLFEIMDLKPESETTGRVLLTHDMVGDIILSNVTFRYGSRSNVFDGLTVTLPKGSLTAVVGESGSGKSTLLAILQGLYPLESGYVRIGECNLNHIDIVSLRKLIGVVPQKIDLFAGNIADNIAVGDDEPDMKRIMQICRELGLLEFIEKLPAGFATYLGENGAMLSGGQKQRLAIARALYRKPEILILDEATSSLDSVSEQFVQGSIRHFREQGKTVILIAHRLSSVMKADKIIVLDEGRLAEEGTHSELLAVKGKYYSLWKYQTPESLRGCQKLSLEG